MEPSFSNSLNRDHIQHLVEAKPDIAREYTISDLLHKIDPSVNIEPLGEELLLDIADDFIDTIVTKAAECARTRGSQTLESNDVRFVIKELFGDSSLLDHDVSRPPDSALTESYNNKLKSINQAKMQASANPNVRLNH